MTKQIEREEAALGATDPEHEGPIIPTTTRGRRTRTKLIQAAEEVFVEHGYLDCKITDITKAAGMSNGSFYSYFRSKSEILAALLEDVNEMMFEAARIPHRRSLSPLQRIEEANRSYIQAYREHAGLMGILEQVATFNAEFREMRRSTRNTFRTRIERSLVRLAESGAIPPVEQPTATAEALTSMVSNFCYVSMVLGEDYDEDVAVEVLTSIWARGIGIDTTNAN